MGTCRNLPPQKKMKGNSGNTKAMVKITVLSKGDWEHDGENWFWILRHDDHHDGETRENRLAQQKSTELFLISDSEACSHEDLSPDMPVQSGPSPEDTRGEVSQRVGVDVGYLGSLVREHRGCSDHGLAIHQKGMQPENSPSAVTVM